MLCTFMALAIMFGLLSPTYAEAKPMIYAANQSVLAGETVEYTVSLSGNPGIAAFMIELSFDKGLFSLEYSETGDPYCASGEVALAGTIVCTETSTGCKVLWYNTANVYGDGILFAIRLKANESISAGDYNIHVSYSKSNTVNVEEQKLNLDCVDGLLTVREYEPKLIGQIATCTSEEVDYSIYVQDNPGIAGLMIELSYDPSAFEPATEAGELTILRGDVFKSGNLVGHSQNGTIRVLWSNAINTYTEGMLFTIKFKKIKGTPINLYPIKVSYDETNTMDQEGNLISFSCTDGAIRAVTKDDSCLILYMTGSDTQDIPAQEKFSGQALALSEAIPQKLGYHFLGWATSPSATNVEYEPQSQYSIDRDLILYPVWVELHNEISQINVTEGEISVQITCSGNAVFVIAIYNDLGQMIEITQKNVENAYYETVVYELASADFSGLIKVFLLDSTKFIPICENAVFAM